MKPHYLIIGIIVVSMFSLGITSYITNLATNYNQSADLSGFDGTQERLEVQERNAQDLSDEITSFKLENLGDYFSIPYKMIKISWKLVRNMFGSWVTVGVMVEESATSINENGVPLPAWLTGSIMAIIITILGAIVIYGLNKWVYTD